MYIYLNGFCFKIFFFSEGKLVSVMNLSWLENRQKLKDIHLPEEEGIE